MDKKSAHAVWSVIGFLTAEAGRNNRGARRLAGAACLGRAQPGPAAEGPKSRAGAMAHYARTDMPIF